MPDLRICATPEEALAGANVCVITTEWPVFRTLDWNSLGESMASRIVVDGRRLLDPETLRRAGFDYYGLGSSGVLDGTIEPSVVARTVTLASIGSIAGP